MFQVAADLVEINNKGVGNGSSAQPRWDQPAFSSFSLAFILLFLHFKCSHVIRRDEESRRARMRTEGRAPTNGPDHS